MNDMQKLIQPHWMHDDMLAHCYIAHSPLPPNHWRACRRYGNCVDHGNMSSSSYLARARKGSLTEKIPKRIANCQDMSLCETPNLEGDSNAKISH